MLNSTVIFKALLKSNMLYITLPDGSNFLALSDRSLVEDIKIFP